MSVTITLYDYFYDIIPPVMRGVYGVHMQPRDPFFFHRGGEGTTAPALRRHRLVGSIGPRPSPPAGPFADGNFLALPVARSPPPPPPSRNADSDVIDLEHPLFIYNNNANIAIAGHRRPLFTPAFFPKGLARINRTPLRRLYANKNVARNAQTMLCAPVAVGVRWIFSVFLSDTF